MDNLKVRNITREEAVKLMGDVFDEECYDFYTDGNDIGFNDGNGTIWERTIGTIWSDAYATYVQYERHCGDSPECCWTEWEVV